MAIDYYDAFTVCCFCNTTINISDFEVLWELGWAQVDDGTGDMYCPHCSSIGDCK